MDNSRKRRADRKPFSSVRMLCSLFSEDPRKQGVGQISVFTEVRSELKSTGQPDLHLFFVCIKVHLLLSSMQEQPELHT